MSRPLQAAANQFDWYRHSKGDQGFSHEGTTQINTHWVKAEIFDKLQGGALSELMGIRSYGSEQEAMEALHKAGGR